MPTTSVSSSGGARGEHRQGLDPVGELSFRQVAGGERLNRIDSVEFVGGRLETAQAEKHSDDGERDALVAIGEAVTACERAFEVAQARRSCRQTKPAAGPSNRQWLRWFRGGPRRKSLLSADPVVCTWLWHKHDPAWVDEDDAFFVPFSSLSALLL